jgi:hypothetical protein
MNTRSKLAAKVREMLNDPYRTETLASIAEHSNVSFAFLNRFKGPIGETEVPSADRLERLYEYLTGKELEF